MARRHTLSADDQSFALRLAACAGQARALLLRLVPPSAPKIDPSRLYENFLAERQEILDYKWIESKRVGEDIGLERALTEWVRKHRTAWRAARKPN